MLKNGYTSEEKALFAGCYSTFFINGMLALVLGAILPYMRQSYGIEYGLAGILLSLHSVGNLVSSFIAGVVPLYIGRRASAVVFSLMGALSFGLMLTGANPLVLMVAFFLTGICRGNISNFNNTAINLLAPGKAWALNLLHSFFAVGAFLCPFMVLAFTQRNPEHWRYAAILLIVLCLAVSCIYGMVHPIDNHPQKKVSDGSSYGFLKSRSFWLAAGILFSYLCTEQGIVGWLVTYFKDSGLLSDSYAQTMASVLWLFILGGRLLCAFLSTKIPTWKLLCISACGYLVFFIIMIVSRTALPITVGIMGLGFFMAGLYPTTISDVGKTLKEYPLAMSTLLTIAGCGSILMPSIIGAVAQQIGIVGGMSTIIVAVVVCMGLIFYNGFLQWKNK